MRYFVIDAFADELFCGNPAGVCLQERELDTSLMQKIASENNLPETAFLLKKDGKYHLRWFTPEVEIDLCGHATLATAFVMMNIISPKLRNVEFETMSGTLTVRKNGDIFAMNFPRRKPEPCEIPPSLEKAMGCNVLETHLSRDLLVLVEKEENVALLQPDFEMLREISISMAFAVIVTAPGKECDFVSRFFAPNAGILEDPVTGSSHSTLIPFWSRRLGKTKMTAKQLSKRGGTLFCEELGDRVEIGGRTKCYLQGEIAI
jgi:PhzF family phenazine biosynthesis protein